MRAAQRGCVCSHVPACACVRQCEQSPRTCWSGLSIPFTEPTRWQSPPRCERHTPEHIQTSLPGSTVKPIYLSVASPVCLSGNPFHHSAILLSVCLHSSVIIGQKKCNTYFLSWADKTFHITQEETTGAPTKTHIHATLWKNPPELPLPCFKHISVLPNAKLL